MSSTSPAQDLDRFIARYTPDIARLARGALARIDKVLPNGVDLYVATFEHGRLDCMIAPLSPAGEVVGDFYHLSP